MAETGHARNAEHFQQMVSFCTGYGTDYDPTNAMIELAALNTALTHAQTSLDDVQRYFLAISRAANMSPPKFFLPTFSTSPLRRITRYTDLETAEKTI